MKAGSEPPKPKSIIRRTASGSTSVASEAITSARKAAAIRRR